jgi:hypothetical protein
LLAFLWELKSKFELKYLGDFEESSFLLAFLWELKVKFQLKYLCILRKVLFAYFFFQEKVRLWGMVKFHIGGRAREAVKLPEQVRFLCRRYSPDEKRKDLF